MKNHLPPRFIFLSCFLFILIFTNVICAAEETTKKASISFSESVFDFGSVYQGEEITHTFKFQNIGNDTLKINAVQASCGCSKAEASIKEIAPGAFGEIEVVFKTAGFEGQQTKNIYVSSNDPINPTTELKLTGSVKLEVEIKPRSLQFGDVPRHKRITKQFEIIQRGEQELIVEKVTSDKKYIEIESIEKKGRGKKNYLVKVTLDSDTLAGNLLDRIEITTNLKRQKRILVGVQGKVLGDIKLSPERLTFRISPSAKRIFPIVLSMEDNTFEVIRVESNVKHLHSEIVELGKFKKYRIDFSVDTKTPPGAIAGKVKIYTNYPGETELVIPIFGWISNKTIEIGYFFERGCLKCERVEPILQYLKGEFPNIVLKEYDIESIENMKLNETLCEIYGVAEDKRMLTPAIFIGKDFLIGESVTKEKLVELVNKYKDGTSLPLNETTKMEGIAEESIIDRFRSFGIFAIIGAGLLDGVNPCAFATMIFLISYLAIVKRKGKELILVGIAFAFSVFITYFLIGIGIFEFLKYITFLKTFTKFVYGIIAIFTLILGILSLVDYFKCKKGKAKKTLLQLPSFLKKRIQNTIREHAGLQRYVFAAFITGFIVSILELSCTGQVYLPTIVYATSISGFRVNAYIYLLLYNLMFIVPLLIIFVLAYLGTTSMRLGEILGKNIALIKLLTSILFFIFTAFLIMMLVI